MHLPYSFGRYTLIEKIASGGTAEVYRAVLHAGEGLTKIVAIKRLLPSWRESTELEGLIVDEGKVLSLLQHGAIAQVMELGRIEGTPFLAMEYVDGIDCARLLSELIREKEPFPIQYALYIIGQVLLALEFAHHMTDLNGQMLGIVHRDVSPSNILLAWNGEVKLTDFGIAKGLHRSHQTQTGQLRGKYSYMAPEQARGEEIDAKADLFACGIVLYELVTATRLFDGRHDAEVLEKVQTANIDIEALSHLPANLRALIMLALSGDTDVRYQSAAEMLLDIKLCANTSGGAISAIEFGKWLKSRFPQIRPSMFEPIMVAATECNAKTKVLESSLKQRNYRFLPMMKIASLFLIIGNMIFFSPYGDAGNASATPSFSNTSATSKNIVSPPLSTHLSLGAIAIDSIPNKASGTLILEKDKRSITTPFSWDNIDITEGVDGEIILSSPGFKSTRHQFRLDSTNPLFIRRIEMSPEVLSAISVHARPWGLVDIAGYASSRETPVNRLKMKPGNYVIAIHYPPAGQTVRTTIALAEGESRQCFAVFDDKASVRCE